LLDWWAKPDLPGWPLRAARTVFDPQRTLAAI
jgi:hypothetical protein